MSGLAPSMHSSQPIAMSPAKPAAFPAVPRTHRAARAEQGLNYRQEKPPSTGNSVPVVNAELIARKEQRRARHVILAGRAV